MIPSSIACMIAPTSSSSVIHDIHCLPEPMRPPTPSLNGSSIRFSAPPCSASTMPLRIVTVRMPASTAGCVSASQASTTSARKSLPARAVLGEHVRRRVSRSTRSPSRRRTHAACVHTTRSHRRSRQSPSRGSGGCGTSARSTSDVRRCSRPRGARPRRRLRTPARRSRRLSGSHPISSPRVAPPRRKRRRGAPHLAELAGQCGADQAARATDDDVHGETVSSASRAAGSVYTGGFASAPSSIG